MAAVFPVVESNTKDYNYNIHYNIYRWYPPSVLSHFILRFLEHFYLEFTVILDHLGLCI